MRRIAILITNYNMPERTDALCAFIRKYVQWPHDLIVVDNGSDLVAPSKYSTLCLERNHQTTGGWLAGLEYADNLARERNGRYFAYWFLITSAEFVAEPTGRHSDPLTTLAELLVDNPHAVGVHPALTADSTTAWDHLKTRGGHAPRRTWMIDNIASLWRADWFDANGRFDPALIYGWGIDLESCWKARRDGKALFVHEGVQMRKITDIGYSMERMNMTAENRRKLAGANMANVLSERYGLAWNDRMRNEFVTNEMG